VEYHMQYATRAKTLVCVSEVSLFVETALSLLAIR